VLAGGVGSRFWPVSTPTRPKQLLPLAGETPLIRQTIDRIEPLVGRERIRILTGGALAGAILGALEGYTAGQLMLEPRARGTAPVLAWAAHAIERASPGAVMLSLHADHVIEPAAGFRAQLARIASLSVRHDRLFTVGAVPNRPETGFGYIRVGPALPGSDEAFEVAEFVEKPVREVAEQYVQEGYLWNTGLFVWPARRFLEELTMHTPEVAAHLPLLDEGRIVEFFQRVPTITVDEGLLERSRRIGVVRAAFDWDDIGAWDAVARTHPTDAAGNVVHGDAHLIDSSGCIAWADDGALVAFGAQDLVIVRAGGVTFVAPRDRASELKELLKQLPPRLAAPGED